MPSGSDDNVKQQYHYPHTRAREEDDDADSGTGGRPSKRPRKTLTNPGMDGRHEVTGVSNSQDSSRRMEHAQPVPNPPRPPEKDGARRLSCKECRRLKLKVSGNMSSL